MDITYSPTICMLGKKARAVACGDVPRRVIGSGFFCGYVGKLANYFQSWEHHGAAVSGRIETTALTTTLGLEEGYAILALVRRGQRQHLPLQVSVSASGKRPLSGTPNLCARGPPKLLFVLVGGVEMKCVKGLS